MDTSNNFPFEEVRRRVFAATDPVDGGSAPAKPSVFYVRSKGSLPANKAIAKGATAEEAKKEQERLMRDHGIETTIG